MGDDFDLFPKRENLDPFSFGTREKKNEAEKRGEESEDLFGGGSPPAAPLPLPELPLDLPAAEPGGQGVLGSLEPTIPDQPAPPARKQPPLIQPPPAEAPLPARGGAETGPISEEKTFDEPSFDDEGPLPVEEDKGRRKTPSPFIVVGGAIIIIIGLLYGALAYLKRDKPPAPRPSAPSVSVAVPVPKPAPVPAPEPGPAQPSDMEGGGKASPAPAPDPAQKPAAKEPEPVSAAPAQPEPARPEPAATPQQVRTAAPAPPAPSTGVVLYSVQVGALILESSVVQLEEKLRSLGQDPFRKEGSTTAMMNMLTVGPFASVSEATSALSKLKAAGVDATLRRRSDGGAVINAGSYLLEENADSVTKKIRSLGYPVRLSKNEARLPMTFVRVGSFAEMGDASSLKDELRIKGFDAIVVKLQ